MSTKDFFLSYLQLFKPYNSRTPQPNNLRNYLRFYKLISSWSALEYSEWTYVLTRLQINTTALNLYVLALFIRTNRLDSNWYFTSVTSTLYSLIYLFTSTVTAKLQTIVLKLPQAVQTVNSTIQSTFQIRYTPTTVAKYLTQTTCELVEVLFLRKNKVFNKGRYSRNRQFYRTGVYWCLYINLIAMIGLYFWFYRFVMNFGYLWWLFYLSLVSFAIAKTFNMDLILPNKLIQSVKSDVIWFVTLLTSFVETLLAYRIADFTVTTRLAFWRGLDKHYTTTVLPSWFLIHYVGKFFAILAPNFGRAVSQPNTSWVSTVTTQTGTTRTGSDLFTSFSRMLFR